MKKDTNYFEKVFYVTKKVPPGRVTTYGAIADYLALGSARMVGWALNKCSFSDEDIPAHRVVNRKGELSGRNQFSSPTMMQELLENEAVTILNNKVVDFENLFWHPGDHLREIEV